MYKKDIVIKYLIFKVQKKRKKFGIRKKVKKYVYEKVGNGSTFQKDGGYINISSTFLF